MSIAAEILRSAVRASQRVRDDHAATVRATAGEFVEHIGKPWKWRLDAIRASRDASDGESAGATE